MSGKSPNILFVFTDQQRSTALGCAGAEDVRTPHLDRLASQGTRFTNAVSNTPICSPARASLLTGLHAMNHGLITNDRPLRTDIPHVAQCLNEAGYRCGYIGKWHVDGGPRGGFIPEGQRRRGFDDFWAVANCTHRYGLAHYYLNDDPEPYAHEGYEPLSQTDIAIEYLESRADSDRPFCLFLSYGPPHFPYMTAPDEYQAIYADRSFRLMPTCQADMPIADNWVRWRFCNEGDSAVDIIAGYYAHQTAIDHCFGRLTAALDRLGLAEDTIVVYTSDHGDMLFNHGQTRKSRPWRESAGVPLLVRWPGEIPAARVSDAPVGLVDMMPTLLGMVGARAPDGLDGRDLSELMFGDESAGPEAQFINCFHLAADGDPPPWRGVVTRQYTYARSAERPILLYDDKPDPMQTNNRVDDPAFAAEVQRLDAMTHDWLQRTNDRMEPREVLFERFWPDDSPCPDGGKGYDMERGGRPPRFRPPGLGITRA